MSKRLLVQMVYDASTNNYPQYFPYPMLLLKIKREEDELLDLNLKLSGEKELIKLQTLNTLIDKLNKDFSEYEDIIVNCGEFPPDGDKTKYFDYFMDNAKFKYKIQGVYPSIAKERIAKKYPENKYFQIVPTDLNLEDVMIPDDMLEAYPKVNHKKKANMKISTGCPRACGMCPVVPLYSKYFKSHDLDKIMDKIHHYYSKGVRHITFTDDNMTANKKFFVDFLDRIIAERANKKFRGLKFLCAEGFEVLAFVNDDLASRIMPAGFYDVKIGMENIDEEFLKKIGKYYTKRATIDQAVENIKKYNIDARLLLLIGLDETEETVMENLRYISKNLLPVRANVLRPYENVKIYDAPFERKFSDERAEYYRGLAYAISWLGDTQKIDLFSPNSFEQLCEKMKFKYTVDGDKHIIEGRLNLGFISTGRCVKCIQYMLKARFNMDFGVQEQNATRLVVVPRIIKEVKKAKVLF